MDFDIKNYATVGACQVLQGDNALDISFFGEGEISFESFSTIKDTVSVSAEFSDSEDAHICLIGVKSNGECEEYRSDKLTGGKLFYTFDPISLSVYRDMQSFFVKVRANTRCRIELKCLDISDDSEVKVSAAKIAVASEKHDAPKKMLFVGNSILLGLESRYGMCSSAPDKDYFHYVSEYVRSKSPDCKFMKLHGSAFEHCESVEAFEEVFYNVPNVYTGKPISESFTDDLDLIILQLGDNINTCEKNATFAVSGDRFLEKIRAASPNARIIWVHGWYNREPTYSYIVRLCEKWGMERVEIGDLRDHAAEAHDQPTFINKEGNPTPVKDGWRTHPGDIGMKRIGEKINLFLNLK